MVSFPLDSGGAQGEEGVGLVQLEMILTSWEGERGGGHESQNPGMSDGKGPLVSSSHSCHLVLSVGKLSLTGFLILSRGLGVQFLAQGHPARFESSLLFSIPVVILWSVSGRPAYSWPSVSNHSPIL